MTPHTTQRGFTLMETIVALAITGIALAMVTPAFIVQAKSNLLSERKTQALEATQRAIDSVRTVSPSILPSSGSTSQTINVDNKNYVVTTTYCQNAALCSSVTRHLNFSSSLNGKTLYETETVFTQLR